jgi:hypothetical protein
MATSAERHRKLLGRLLDIRFVDAFHAAIVVLGPAEPGSWLDAAGPGFSDACAYRAAPARQIKHVDHAGVLVDGVTQMHDLAGAAVRVGAIDQLPDPVVRVVADQQHGLAALDGPGSVLLRLDLGPRPENRVAARSGTSAPAPARRSTCTAASSSRAAQHAAGQHLILRTIRSYRQSIDRTGKFKVAVPPEAARCRPATTGLDGIESVDDGRSVPGRSGVT